MSRSASRRIVMALLVLALVLPVGSVLAVRASAEAASLPTAGTAAAVGSRDAWVLAAVAGETVRIGGATPEEVRRPVVLQRRADGRWRAVGRARTDGDGRYAFDVRAQAMTYRVRARGVQAGRERLPAWTSRMGRVRLLGQRGEAFAPETVAAGAAVSVRAAFAPARAGRPVRLEAREHDGWAPIGRGVQNADGEVALTARPAASTTYRVVATAWRGAAAVATAPVTVTPTSGGGPVANPVQPAPVPSTEPVPGPGPGPGPGPDPGTRHRPWVTGYYAAWFWNWLYPPEEVDMTAMTHFVFGRVAPGGGSLGGVPTGLEQGAWSAQEPGGAPDGSGRSIEDYLIDKAHAAGTSALLMLGGDGYDGRGFMLSTADDQRAQFVENIVDYLVEHDYDGVDLDWENCLSGEADCGEGEGEDPIPAAEARRRLLALIADLRAEMATRSRYAAAPGLITFPGYAVKINELQEGDKVEQWQADVANAVDQYNLMSYGIGTTYSGGGWLSWFSGALFGADGQHPVDISSSVDAYVRTGVPRDRIGIGIGFYGVYFGPSITGPRQPTDDNDIYEIQDAALAYSELDRMGYLSHGEGRWDEEARSTYRVYGDGGFVPEPEGGLPPRNAAGFLSYEDERSIAAKGAWVRETGVGGTILWTINYGWLPRTGTNPLLDAVKTSFLGD